MILLLGIFLVIWATVVFAWLSGSLADFNASVATNDQEQHLKDSALYSLKIWVFVFPAVTLAIGANLLTNYILTGKDS